MVISTGIIVPFLSCVASLNCLMNSPMFIPCWAKEGPTGGAGGGVPPGVWRFTICFFGFAIIIFLLTKSPVQPAFRGRKWKLKLLFCLFLRQLRKFFPPGL